MLLPSPETCGLPFESAVAVPVPREGLILYRLLRGPAPVPGDFEPTWTRPQAQLRQIPELFRSSVSHWLSREQALRHSEREEVYLAQVELRPQPLIRVALTEQFGEGHVDVWGYPRDLLAAAVDVAHLQRRT